MSVNYYDKRTGKLIQIAGNANGTIDDTNVSNKTTYSSEKIEEEIETLKTTQYLEYDGENITCENTLTSRTSDVLIKGQTYQNSITGIESAGEKENKILILSHNKNLTKINLQTGMLQSANGQLAPSVTNYTSNINYDLINGGQQYTISANKQIDAIFYYDENKSYISNLQVQSSTKTFTTPSNCKYIRYRFTTTNIPSWVQLELGNNKTPYVEPKQDKKEILLPVVGGLKALPNGVCDTIEQRADGVYLVQRVDKVVLNGSEGWGLLTGRDTTKTLYFQFPTVITNIYIICDKIKVLNADYLWNNDVEGLSPNGKGNFHFRIDKSRLSTQDVDGLKAWLRANPVTIYYVLNIPVETKLDINNLGLEIYEGLTYMTTDNAIQPVLSFKVPNNIGSMVQGNTQNINELFKLIDNDIFSTYDTLYYESKRLFKPKFGGFIDTFPNGERIKTTDEVKARLDLFKDAGIDEWVIQPWIFKDSNFNIVCYYDVEEIKKQVVYAKSIGVTPICLKIHMFEISESDVKDRITLEKFKSQYKKCVIDLAEGLKNLGIKYCVVFNENEWLYGDKTWDPYVLEIINEVKAMGYSTGISTMGIKNTLIMSEDILNAVDAFFGNTYPEISNKLENTSINDAVESINSNQCLRTFKYLKNKYEKEVILSEVGVMDYWACLNDPGRWNWTNELKVPSNGRTEKILLEGMAKSDINSDLTNHVWWCYDNLVSKEITREILRNILRGE